MFRTGQTLLSLHSQTATGGVALCAALTFDGGAEAPEWIHLLPAGEIRTGDGRGPYHVTDIQQLMADSLQAGDRLPIDENHSTDLAAPRGEPAPARGWMVALQARTDGLWAQVEWTGEGQRLLKDKAYRGISPVIQHTKDGRVTAVLRASLVNKPNLRGLTALHSQDSDTQETNMYLLAKLLAALKLPETTTEDALVTAVTAMHSQQSTSSVALQAALDPIAKAIGLQAGADAAAVLAGVEQVKTGGGNDQVIVGLQAELTNVTTQLNTLLETTKRDKATDFVGKAIELGRAGVKAQEAHYVTMHMENPTRTEQLVNAMPIIGGGLTIIPAVPPGREGDISLNAEQKQVARQLGITEAALIETLKAEQAAL